MILEAALINLTRNLDILNQNGKEGVSSHSNQKKEALICLTNLIRSAPLTEFRDIFSTDSFEILFGYLFNVLCHISKNDREKSVRILSVELISLIVDKFHELHDLSDSNEKCTVDVVLTALPGVSSALFKLIMSDTKLPRELIVSAAKSLGKMVSCVYLPCRLKSVSKLAGPNLENTSENLAVRLKLLVGYVMRNSNVLSGEVAFEVLILCDTFVRKTKPELSKRIIETIVNYCAFISSTDLRPESLKNEAKVRVMLVIDNIREQVMESGSTNGDLDSIVISKLLQLLNELDNDYLSTLIEERYAGLATFHGFLMILPPNSLETLLEMTEKRAQIFKVFMQLAKFSTDQAFLFLTDRFVPDNALETCDENIYTFGKKFAYIDEREVRLLAYCSTIIGRNMNFQLTKDVLRSELGQFTSAENLYVSHLILQGSLERSSADSRLPTWAKQMVEHFVERIHEEYIFLSESSQDGDVIFSQSTLKIVIAIELMGTILRIFLKFSTSQDDKTVILRSILCPLLNWASSPSRAISEAALACLSHLSHLYNLGSIKSLIVDNIDYIVDGVSKMLDNFACNSQVTSVLAITFKLSSIESFYYFNDIFERVFTLLGSYHQTRKSKTIALLFYRTLAIMEEWDDAQAGTGELYKALTPLDDETMIEQIKYELNIDRRLKSFDEISRESSRRQDEIDQMLRVTSEEESEISRDIECAKGVTSMKKSDTIGAEPDDDKETRAELKKNRPVQIVLTEKILKHCVNLASSNFSETKTLALKSIACGLKILRDDEDTLLPLVHELWTPLLRRLTENHENVDLEIKMSAFECLMSMAYHSKDFLKRRTLDSVLPRLCLFLESQARYSIGQKSFGPYSLTASYKCQLRVLSELGALAYHIQVAYTNLWRMIRVTLTYMEPGQAAPLREAALRSLNFLIALDPDCVWYFAKKSGKLNDLPLNLIYNIN